MCALVLALRKIPIYAPGGGGATLGSNDMPSYSVAISDAEAAANRDKFAKAQEAKRMVPSPGVKRPDSDTLGDPTGADTRERPSTTVRNRNLPASTKETPATEKAILDTLHTRPPSNDAARDSEALPRSLIHSPSSSDPSRNDDFDEIRTGLLRRQTTLGKRRGPQAPNPSNLNMPGISERSLPPRLNMGFNDFVASAESPVESPVEMIDNSRPMDQVVGARTAGGNLYPQRSPQYQAAVQAQQAATGTQQPQIRPQNVRRLLPGSGNAFPQEPRQQQVQPGNFYRSESQE